MKHVNPEELAQAIALVKSAGFNVSKPRAKKLTTVGPTFVANWSDGVVTRMSIHTNDMRPDVGRAVRVSAAAYDSRTKGLGVARLESGSFERGGKVLHTYAGAELRPHL